MCETYFCISPWLPDSALVSACLTTAAGLVVWKIVKAIIDTIPIIG